MSFNYTKYYPASIYLLKVNYRKAGIKCEMYSKFTIKTPERCQWLVIVNFEHVIASWINPF